MVKIALHIFVTIVIFTTALYTGFLSMLGAYIGNIKNNFLPFIPLQFRLLIFMVLIAVLWALANSFIN